MRVLYALMIVAFSLTPYVAHAEPRTYPDGIFNNLELLFDIMLASDLGLDVSDPEVIAWAFPERSFEDFDRNRSGTFIVNPNGEPPIDWASTDLALAFTQFNHDTVDFDGDGLIGFVELECAFAERAPDQPAVSLSPEDSSSDGVTADGDLDCDGDGATNAVEARYGLNPLDGFDLDLDLDGDGIANRDELRIGTHPGLADTDGDGLNDDSEVGPDLDFPLDSNQDGVIDALEPGTGYLSIRRESITVGGVTHASRNFKVKSTLLVGGNRSSSAQFEVISELTP